MSMSVSWNAALSKQVIKQVLYYWVQPKNRNLYRLLDSGTLSILISILTQNRSFRRCFSQPVSWLVYTVLKFSGRKRALAASRVLFLVSQFEYMPQTDR